MAFAAKESEASRNSQGARRLAKAFALDRAWKAAQSWQSLLESVRFFDVPSLGKFLLVANLSARFVVGMAYVRCMCFWPFCDFRVFFLCYLATYRVNCFSVMLLFAKMPTNGSDVLLLGFGIVLPCIFVGICSTAVLYNPRI